MRRTESERQALSKLKLLGTLAGAVVGMSKQD